MLFLAWYRKLLYLAMAGWPALMLAACSLSTSSEQDGPPRKALHIAAIPKALPKAEPRSRYGNPKSYKVFGKRYYVLPTARGYTAKGLASWYGKKFHGRRTSSGERYDMYAMTAAHKTLPLPTYLAVTHLDSGKKIVVRVNDRGPFHANRLLDLSYAAALTLGITAKGTALVAVKALSFPEKQATTKKSKSRGLPQPVFPYFFQAGAFSQWQNADRLRAKLEKNGISGVSIHSVSHHKKPLCKVWIGPANSNAEIAQLKTALSALALSFVRVSSNYSGYPNKSR